MKVVADTAENEWKVREMHCICESDNEFVVFQNSYIGTLFKQGHSENDMDKSAAANFDTVLFFILFFSFLK